MPRLPCRKIFSACCLVCGSVLAGVSDDDCDQNGLPDSADIARDPSLDCDADGVLDECQPAPLRFSLLEGDVKLSGVPTAFLALDIDLDGATDLAYLHHEGDEARLTLLRSLGNALFALSEPLVVGEGFSSLVAHDPDGVGRPDLIAASSSAHIRLPHDGKRAFGKPVPLSSVGASFLASTDLDADGRADLLSLDRSEGTLTLYPGHLEPGQSLVPVSVGASAAALVTADFDGDGVVDGVVVRAETDDAVLLRGVGDGTFADMSAYPLGLTSPFLAETSDVDGDGDPDLVVGAARDLVLLENLGTGFATAAPLGAGGRLTSFIFGDFDRDGDPDLAQSNTLTDAVTVRQNLGAGRFLAGVPVPAGWTPRLLVSGDFDGDEDLDLAAVVGDATSGRASVLFAGEALPPSKVAFDSVIARVRGKPHGIATGDFNADGFADVATGNGSQGTFSVLFGDANANLEFDRSYGVQGRATLFSVAAGDWDGDGDVDVAAAGNINSQVLVRLNAGDGTFFDASFHPTGSAPLFLVAADYDQDGALDFITANESANTISLLRNAGDGTTWEAPVQTRVGSRPVAVAVADIDSDGDPDLAVSSLNAREVAILPGRGDGTFERGPIYPVLGPARFVTASDLDQSGDVELLVAHGSLVSIYRRQVGSELVESRALDTRQAPYSLLVTDLDGDGQVDLLTTNTIHRTYGTLSVFLGRGDLEYESPFRLICGAEPRFAVAIDIEQDGDVDLITGNRTSETITRLRQDLAAVPPPETCDGRQEVLFLRGDVNADGRRNIVDAVNLLATIAGTEPFSCTKSADLDDSGTVNVTDVVDLLDFLFQRGGPPADPATDCGVDPTADKLECSAFSACR